MALHRVLVVDSDRVSREALAAAVRSLGLRVIEAPNPRRLGELLDSTPPDVLLLDPRLEQAPGEDLLERIRARHPGLPLVLLGEPDPAGVSASGDEWLARSCGPAEIERLLERVERRQRLREENEYLRGELLQSELEPLVARSASMAEALRSASRCARSRAAVLIAGEPGTGKRRLARHVHAHSSRAPRPIVRVLAAQEDPLELERRLFGDADGPGHGPALLELADGGTLLVVELTDLASSAQERLAAALAHGRFEPRGGRALPVDLRLIATTRHTLASARASSAIAPELLSLVSELAIELAPLRERRDDVLPLAERFAARAARELGHSPPSFTEEAQERLVAWSWPGNVSELEHVVRRAVLLAPGARIDAGSLGFASAGARDSDPNGDPEADLARRLADLPVADIERIAILATLDSAGGNKTEAARRLGLTARTLSNKLKLWRSQGLVV